MVPLSEAFEALRRAAAAGKIGRLSVDLRCVIRVSENRRAEFWALTETDSAAGQAFHAIRFEVNENVPSGLISAAGSAEIAGAATTSDDLVQRLVGIFGEPGFDNAARASVFIEIMEQLSPLQAAGLIESFRSDPAEVPLQRPGDGAVATARTRVTRLVKLGPAGLEGVPKLIRILEENGVGPVLRVTRDVWKTQDAWIDANSPDDRRE